MLRGLQRQPGIQKIREVTYGVAALDALHEHQPYSIVSGRNLAGERSTDYLHITGQDDKLKDIPH